MATVARSNSLPVIVEDDELVPILADMLEKMDLIEAKLMQLSRQGTLPGTATGSRVEIAKVTAQALATKAVTVARDAVLFCERLETARSCLEPRRAPTRFLQ